MSQNNSRLVTVHAVRRTCCLKERASDHSSDSRAYENGGNPTAVSENALIRENDRSAPGGCGVGKNIFSAHVARERTAAAFTLRAGGRVLKVVMHACGGTESHMEVLSSEKLTLEQWARLWDKVQELTHSMILLDHPDD